MKLFKLDYVMKCFMLLLFTVSMSNFALAQRTVTGTIIDDETKEPLIGANILVVGTSTGTVTDFNGAYSIEVPEGASELEITYTGYGAKRVALGASNIVDAALQSGEFLDEVVVVGYGTVKKKDATGAVVGVSSKDFNKGVISSPEELIQGRAAGVQITSSSGEPGAGVNIRIRGASSVRNGNNPLFVVDGVPLTSDDPGGVQAGGQDSGFGSSSARNPLNFLNPSDIESIDILKDASATAIYGSRGANGVVIITTKKGREGSGSLEYGYSLGVSSISKKFDLLGRQAYLDAWSGFNPTANVADQDFGADTDWQDVIFRTAITHNHNISFGGASSEGSYRFTVGYQDQEGIVENSGLRRITARFNGDRSFINDRLNISTQITVSDVRDDNVPITDNSGFEGDLMAAALKFNPTIPEFDANGEPVQISLTEPNPRAILDNTRSFTNTVRALASVTAELKLTDELSFSSRVGYDRSIANRTDAFSGDLLANGIWNDINDPAAKQGRLFLNDYQIQNTLWENFFTYNKDLTDNVSLNAIAGYSYQEFVSNSKRIEMTNFRTTNLDLMINNYAASDVRAGNSIVPTNSSLFVDELQSFYTRFNVGVNDKYLFTATVRADGSTKFGSGNQYGIFPSGAFKWKLAEEDFMTDAFDEFSLRLNVGVTGNQEYGNNLFTDRERFADFDIDNGGNINGGGLAQVAFNNESLKWESTLQYGAGIDFAIMDYKITGSLDFYRKTTNDLLIQLTSAQPAPNPFVWTNLDADIINTGIELGLNVEAYSNEDFSWNVNANFAYNDNTVEGLGDFVINTGAINGQGLTGAFVQRIADGQPLYAFFLREFAGFSADGSVQEYVGGDVQKFLGKSPLPTVNVGLTNSFNYGNLSFSFFFAGQFGHYIYSNTANAFFTAGSIGGGRNVTTDVIGNGEDRTNAPDVSTRFLEKGDFVRLQNVSLGYNFDIKSDVISSLRVFATGQNLFVLTGYSGQDPEVNTNKQIDGVPSFGIDYTSYPRARAFTFGANITF